MKFLNIVILISFFFACSRAQENSQSSFNDFEVNVVADNLEVPWEIVYGPDNHIWFTERPGRISRLNPETGNIELLITINEVIAQSETGLLGLALDPDFDTSPFVYTVYTYFKSGELTERVVRFTYDGAKLINQEILLDDIPAANNHSGSRLLFMPDKTLLITTGDALNTSNAQNLNSLAGKTLRIDRNGNIPANNPDPNSFIYSWGHRNAQGLTLSPNGIIYSSEHGPNTDDEINIIEANRNYGWPTVKGFCDAGEQQDCDNLNVKEPIKAFTPTLAVAGIAFYQYNNIKAFENSLLLVSLKEADLRVFKLSNDGLSVISDSLLFDRQYGRLRSICTAPNGDVFIGTSNRDGRAPGGFPKQDDDKIIRISAKNSTGLLEKKFENFSMPNPVQASIDFSALGYVDADILNAQGQKIISAKHTKEMLVDGLSQGWYILNVFTKTASASKRFYKQ